MTKASVENRSRIKGPLPWHLSIWTRLTELLGKAQLAHAYLVCGEKGTGKYRFISAFANYMLCKNPSNYSVCGKCGNCIMGAAGFHPDILQIEPEVEGKDIKIEQVRALSEFVLRTSHAGMVKVVLINQAHQLNNSAANALLKTLEEPTQGTYLFLVSDLPGVLPATVRSRCQRLQMPVPTAVEASDWLHSCDIPPQIIPSLLIAANNRPLLAVEQFTNGDEVDGLQIFAASLLLLLKRRCSIQIVAGQAVKIGEIVTLEYLATISSIVIRYLLSNHSAGDSLISDLVSEFKSTSPHRKLLLVELLNFNWEVERGKHQLRAGNNPNPQLMLESLLWQWHQLASGTK